MVKDLNDFRKKQGAVLERRQQFIDTVRLGWHLSRTDDDRAMAVAFGGFLAASEHAPSEVFEFECETKHAETFAEYLAAAAELLHVQLVIELNDGEDEEHVAIRARRFEAVPE